MSRWLLSALLCAILFHKGDGCLASYNPDIPPTSTSTTPTTTTSTTTSTTTTTTSTTTTTTTRGCPAMFMINEDLGFCYYLGTTMGAQSVQDLQMTCQNMGGNLASVHSQAENDYITSLVPAGAPAKNIVIGPTRAVPGTMDGNFNNFDGTPFDFNNFGGAEPNGGDCVYIVSDTFFTVTRGQWIDVGCSLQSQFFVCKSAII